MMWGYGPNWGMMDPWGGYGGGGPVGLMIWIVVLALVIAAVAWLVRSLAHPGHHFPVPARRSPGLEVLEERYARGDIKREEYLEKKRDLWS